MSRRDDTSLSPLLRSLVDAERRRPGCPPAEEARLLDRIESSLDWIDSQPATGETPEIALRRSAARAPRPPRLRFVAAAVLLAAFAIGVAARAAYRAVSRRSAPPRELAAPKAPADAPPAPVPAPAPAPAPAPPPRAAPQRLPEGRPAARPPSREPRSSGEIERERELLEMARAALALQRFGEARSALDRHLREHPGGQLSEERDSLTVQLLLASGDFEAAQESAARFRARHPASIFWPSMERELARAAAGGGR